MAPLALTIEADERVGAKGEVVAPLDEAALRAILRALRRSRIEALTVSLINAFANDAHERRVKEIAQEELPGIPVSLSSEVVPEMQEYERTVTTVANSYVRPRVAEVRAQPAGQARETREGRQAAHPALRRRPRLGGLRRGVPGQPADVGPGRRRDRRAVGRGAGGIPEPAHHRRRRHLDRRRADPERRAAAAPRDHGRRRHRARILGRHPHRRRGRRLDRARAGTDQGAARRPAERRRRSRPGRLRQGRHRADGHRRQHRARLPAGDAAARRRHGAGPRARRRRPCRRSPMRSACRSSTPRSASTTSSTRTCSARCAWYRSSRVTTRATTH